jgi:hypothetical protein
LGPAPKWDRFLATAVQVNDDNCVYKTLITVTKHSADRLSLDVKSDCKNIKEIATSIGPNVNYIDVIESFDKNVIYRKVAENILGCVTCAVPCAITKALWAELGMTLKKDTRIQFMS